jgi:NADH-quinone oxidoreductase subunit J
MVSSVRSRRLGIGGLVAARAVIRAANPVHAVFYLVLVFGFCSRLRISLAREFRGLVFLRVYVGAIAVLFLFVVRRLNVQPDIAKRPSGNIPRLLVIGRTFVARRWSAIGGDRRAVGKELASGEAYSFTNYTGRRDRISNRESIGQVLYTTYAVEFLRAGLVLLVARIGAVVLTQTGKHLGTASAVRQQVHQQHSRNPDRAIFKVREFR